MASPESGMVFLVGSSRLYCRGLAVQAYAFGREIEIHGGRNSAEMENILKSNEFAPNGLNITSSRSRDHAT